MKGDNFQSALTRAHTSSPRKCSLSSFSKSRSFFFHFHNFYAAAGSFLGICFEFCCQCIFHCFCTDLELSDVPESSLSPVQHHGVSRVSTFGQVARTCYCWSGWQPSDRKSGLRSRRGRSWMCQSCHFLPCSTSLMIPAAHQKPIRSHFFDPLLQSLSFNWLI